MKRALSLLALATAGFLFAIPALYAGARSETEPRDDNGDAKRSQTSYAVTIPPSSLTVLPGQSYSQAYEQQKQWTAQYIGENEQPPDPALAQQASSLLSQIKPLPTDSSSPGVVMIQQAESALQFAVDALNNPVKCPPPGSTTPCSGTTLYQQMEAVYQANDALQAACTADPLYCSGNYAPVSDPSTPTDPTGAVGAAGSGGSSHAVVGGGPTNWDPTFRAKLTGLGDPSPASFGTTSAQRTAQEDILSRTVTILEGTDSPARAGASAAGFARLTPQQQAGNLLRSAGLKLKLGDKAGALKDALQAIALDPQNPIGFLRAAEAYNHLRQFDDAEKMARQAIAVDPNNAQAWKNLAWALLKQGRYKDALAAALTAVRLKPDMAQAWAIAAYAAERLGDKQASLSYIQKAASLDPRYQEKLAAARRGEKIYSDDYDDFLDDGAAGRARGSNLPLAAGGAAVGASLLGLLTWLRRRRKAAANVDGAAHIPPPTALPRTVTQSPQGVVIDKYQLGVLIGRGGMCEVFLATDIALRRQVAVKKMTKTLSDLGSEARGLFIKEARTVAQLHHPAIVDIYDIVDSGGDVYLVFELVRGKTVQHLLAESGKIPLKRTVEILKPVCEALEFAHGRSMVHRDLKPANIMVTEQGHIKLMDFGIARSLADAGARKTTVLAGRAAPTGVFDRTMHAVGTPAYMAPEAEAGVICIEGDVYSLGVTLYEMLTGQLPFGPLATSAEKEAARFPLAGSITPGLPPEVDVLIAAALHPSPTDRVKTAADFLARLEGRKNHPRLSSGD